jgi:hypothetical protein
MAAHHEAIQSFVFELGIRRLPLTQALEDKTGLPYTPVLVGRL